jgi:hypothetical protein
MGFTANRSLHMLYRCADVAVFPSLYEPFGIVALEAMAANVAVVTSDAGGFREVVLHDETGTTCFANNAESLAWAVLRVVQDPKRAEKLRTAARSRLDVDFNWSKLATKTIEVYDRVWSEFLESYWMEDTLWPVSPGAEARAEERRIREKAEAIAQAERPLPAGGSVLNRPEQLDEEFEEAL